MSGNGGKPGVDEEARRAASGASDVRESTVAGVAGKGGKGSQPQAGQTAVEEDGNRSDLSEKAEQSTRGRTRNLSVSAEGTGDNGTKSSMVQRHNVYSYAAWVYVFGCGDGLVESIRSIVGIEQHDGGGVLHSSVGAGAGACRESAADFEHGSGVAIHESGIHRRGAIVRSGSEHGWAREMDGQPVHREVVEEREI